MLIDRLKIMKEVNNNLKILKFFFLGDDVENKQCVGWKIVVGFD